MTAVDPARFWILALALGAITYAMRLSFMALMRRHAPPPGLIRALKFAPFTILPAILAPMVVFPASGGGAVDPLRILAAVAALVVGAATRSMLATIGAGAAVFWGLGALL
ncbi:AzlD domain-containing protein [Neomegalonema sp.]|uniref:AzlD domain-containing protein n=1 Tax=Neomegalonema sp. TaxID=2039713 RepID=UPI0026264684|nr:AzlD domain-containing protein [Neomegalonema sp.]MDD2869170.1 AzlD domain-containing protein [Neomegalonema sp.]